MRATSLHAPRDWKNGCGMAVDTIAMGGLMRDKETIKTNKVSWNTVLNDLERAFREIK